jgi:hypothetical protein
MNQNTKFYDKKLTKHNDNKKGWLQGMISRLDKINEPEKSKL